MNNETRDPKSPAGEDTVELPDDDFAADTIVMTEMPSTDTVGDVSAEINVEALIAEVEAIDDEQVAHKKEVRQRLEEMAEEKSFEDTYAIDFDNE
ncbi:MAG: hypothetical protein BMS9Abin32_306 [Gammaproteobacteria bacterium]|nr:MAG: hypothetical protein BMS9Abin32_306 [Gammaproteobacteria bacterium]